MRPIDLRSDTVTRPTEAMRRAIAAAEVGDDVFGDDPSVNRLEAMAAERLGREAAVFVPSGTMANLSAVLSLSRPGEEVLLGEESHIFNYEAAGVARVAGLLTHVLPNNRADGSVDVEAVRAAVRAPNIHAPRTSLLCLENTHNRCGGAVMPAEVMGLLIDTAHESGLRVHVDGARIFNAESALGVPAAEITRGADTVSFCLSKGLGCPVGSVVTGSREAIAEARRQRKLLGGGMRQAGVLAAAGIYALEHHVERLREDHANAARLAEGLAAFEVFAPLPVASNIVAVDLRTGTGESWTRALREAGVLCTVFGPRRVRFVTHLDVTADDIEEALRRVERTVATVPV